MHAKIAVWWGLGATMLLATAAAQPVTEAADPAMIRARDWLQELDRGQYDAALQAADERLAKRGLEKFTAEVQKARRGEAMPSCRTGLYVELLDDGAEASFVARYGNDRVTEHVTLRYDPQDVLHPTEYKISGSVPKDSKACS